MQGHLPRYKINPYLTDTVGFFDSYVPYTNQSKIIRNDSIRSFSDFSVYDFISRRSDVKESRQVNSIFGSSQVHFSKGPKPIEPQATDWVTGLIIICMILLAWIQASHSKRLKQIIRSVALPYYVNQLEREGNLYNERITLGLGFIYITGISMLLYLFYQQFSLSAGMKNYVVFLLIFGGVVAYIVLKAGLIQMSGVVFKTQDQTHAYRLNALIFNHTTGIFIFPVLLLAIYWESEPFIWIAAGLLSIMLIYRFIRSISIGLSNSKFSVFYLILYLCTLEILPLIVLAKFIRQF